MKEKQVLSQLIQLLSQAEELSPDINRDKTYRSIQLLLIELHEQIEDSALANPIYSNINNI